MSNFAVSNFAAGLPIEVLATIFGYVPTWHRHDARCVTPHRKIKAGIVSRAKYACKRMRLKEASACARAQSVPLVCRRWRDVLTGPSAAWRSLNLDSSLARGASVTSFFDCCSRTRCIEVGAGSRRYTCATCATARSACTCLAAWHAVFVAPRIRVASRQPGPSTEGPRAQHCDIVTMFADP